MWSGLVVVVVLPLVAATSVCGVTSRHPPTLHTCSAVFVPLKSKIEPLLVAVLAVVAWHTADGTSVRGVTSSTYASA